MVTIANYSVKAGSLILGVAGAAAGLNMSVLALQPDLAGGEEAASVVIAGDPEVIQVEVDVPIPAAQASTDTSAAGAASVGPAMTAAPAPAAPASAAPRSAPAQPATTPAGPVPSPPSTAAPTSSAPTPAPTSPTPTDPATTATTQPVPVTEYLTYPFDGVATIVVALHDGNRLEFWSVNAQSGWSYQVEKDDGRTVKIEFEKESGGDEEEAVFEVKIENGDLRVKRER